jgi:flagellar motility protein MotE (MotC chaperone)
LKNIITIALMTFGIISGGYFAYLKISTGKQIAKQENTVTVDKEQVSGIELGMNALAQKKLEIVEVETRLKSIQSDIQAEKAALIQEQEKLQALLDKVIEAQNQLADGEERSIRKLAKMYEMMKPKEAAEIAANLNMDLLVQIIPRMKEKSAAKLIAELDTGKAVQLTKALSGNK